MRRPETAKSAFGRVVPFITLLATALLPAPAAQAQDPFAEEDKTGPAPEGVKGEKHQSLTRPKVDEPETPPPVGPVERLPPTAFPEWKVRGLHGGSLWLTFHGMPWPYYPKTGIGVSGYGWVDTGYEQIDRTVGTATQEKYLIQQGRAALRLTPTFTSGEWFVQGQVEFIGNKDQTVSQPNVADVDDLWVRAGKWRSWDVMAGRFEGFEVYHFGMGLDLNTLERQGARDPTIPGRPPDVEGLRWGALRPSGVGHFALHMYLADVLRVELMARVGNESNFNTLGARPAAVLDFGWLKLKAAGHYHRQTAVPNTSIAETKSHGATGAVQIILFPIVELGVNADYGYVDSYGNSITSPPMPVFNPEASYTTVSVGGFTNVRVMPDTLVGLGVNYVTLTDAAQNPTTGAHGEFSHLQGFVALQYAVARQLFVKFVGGYARATFAPTSLPEWENSMVSGRIRLLYLF